MIQQPVIDFLKQSLHPDQVIETHGAIVFLSGEKAYKLKKQVDFPYMDYSTPQRRAFCCEREIQLNRRTAPDLYLETASIVADKNGALSLNNEGHAVDTIVIMQRFDQAKLLDDIATKQGLSNDIIAGLIDNVVNLHKTASSIKSDDGYAPIQGTIMGNDGQFAAFSDYLDRDKTKIFTQKLCNIALEHKALLNKRAKNGFIKQCHGDLHLRNLVMLNDKPVAFDAIEFNDAFAQIDTAYDLAFLLMDLDYRGLKSAFWQVLNGYLDQTADYDMLQILPLFLAIRASIRAHVGVAIALSQDDESQHTALQEAQSYLDLAVSYLQNHAPSITAIGGLSGSGKSTLAAQQIDQNGGIWLRTDVLRKHIMGTNISERLDSSGYTDDITTKTYDLLFETTKKAIHAKFDVVLDAVFAKQHQRDAVDSLAKEHNISLKSIWLDTPLEVAKQRLNTRQHDYSDATAEVRNMQENYDLGTISWQKHVA